MGDLEPITRNEKLWSGEDLTPVTRKEMYIKHLYDETQVIPDHPVTREEMFILKAGEELHDVTIEQLTATENRTYSEEGVAYSPVIVNVPAPSVMSKNITENGDYSASDDNVYGYSSVHVAVPQTTLTTLDVSANGTYTAPSGTAYSEVEVDVPLPENAYLLKEIEDVEIASFNDGSDLSMPKLEVAIEPVQEGSGDPSPENIRPISGWDEVNVGVTSKNLVNWKWNTFNDGKMEIFLKGGTYTLSAESTLINGNAYIRGTKPNGEYVSREELGLTDWGASSTSGVYYGGGGQQTYTINVPNGGAKIEFGKLNNNGTIPAQLEFGSTPTEYTPYNPNGSTITIQLGDTYYGGTLDVVSGVMTVTHGYSKFNQLEWTHASPSGSVAYDYFTTTSLSSVIKTISGSTEITTILNSAFPKCTSSQVAKEGYDKYLAQGGYTVFIADSDYHSVNDFLTAFGNEQLVYELATPLTIQLTPTVVKSLRGKNNVFADSGNILDLSYLAKEE